MDRHASFPFVAAIALPLISAGCAEGPCSPSETSAVDVIVLDSVTGAPAAKGARLIIRDGAYADTAVAYDPWKLVIFNDERAGTYDVVVQKANYRDWVRFGVEAKKISKCEFQAAVMTARLQGHTRSR